MSAFYNFIGKAVCHQLPDRSFNTGGLAFPVCARCSGLYFGFLVSVIFIAAFRRTGGNKPFSAVHSVFLTLCLLPMMTDIATSYLGLRRTDNITRYITGALFACAVPFFFTLLKNFRVDGENNKMILRPIETLFVTSAACLPVFMFVNGAMSNPAYYAGGALVSVSVYLVFYFVCGFFIAAPIKFFLKFCASIPLFNRGINIVAFLGFKGRAGNVLRVGLPVFIICALSRFYAFFGG